MRDVIDALRTLFVTAAGGAIASDDSLSEPIEYEPGVLYAWEEASAHTSIGTGEVREDFEIRLVYPIDNAGEVSAVKRSRSVSEALDSLRGVWLDAIREHQNSPPWDSGTISGTVNADLIRQLGLRGLGIIVRGYRIVT